MNTSADHVLFAGAWDDGPGYPRARSLRQGLEAAGLQVRECREPGLGRGKQALLRAPWRLPACWWRQQRQHRRLQQRLGAAVAEQRPRCIVVPYPGHAVVQGLRAATDVPIVLDLFLSAYDTVVEDRELVRPGSLLAAWLQRLDARACAAADLVLLDTPANAAYVAALTGLPAERFAWLPVGDPDAEATVTPPAPSRDGRLRLLFFGTGVPLHGLAVLIEAVAWVPAVELTLVGGTPPDRARAVELLGDRLRLEPEFVDRARLQQLLHDAQLVAGVFGGSGKAQRVVPFKVVHALAAGRPVVTADTPALAGWLDGCGAVATVPAADAAALAAALRALAAAPDSLAAAAAAARPAFDRHFAVPCLARRWRELLARLQPAAEAA
ncbi:MAG: glycosyltransferase [Planctomycetes bacterium]|nr:glycosyltransferase [Planctomycetota bacterium]